MEIKHTGFALAQMLMGYGVEYIFGIPGGQTLPLYDACYAYSDRLKHITVRDERHGGHAALAYSRMSGKVGVCDATVGPGATNLPSALGEALNSSTPMIAIVGEHPTGWANKIDFGRASQGIDQISMLKAVTKKVVYVPTQDSLPELVHSAFLIATTGRPGPVALVIPADVFRQEGGPKDFERYIDPSLGCHPSRRSAPADKDVAKAADLLRAAKSPVMMIGGGALLSGAEEAAQEVAEALSMPVVYTITGKGTLADDHPLNMGVSGLGASSPSAKAAMQRADVVFIVGSKSPQGSTFIWTMPSAKQRVIHLDVDPAEIGRVFKTEVGLVGDARLGLGALLDALANDSKPSRDGKWVAQLHTEKEAWLKKREELFGADEVPIKPYRVMSALNQVLSPDDILVCDAGFASSWGSLYFDQRMPGRRTLFPRGLAGLGFSVAAGVGAQLAAPNQRVVTLAGDGGFCYDMNELSVMAKAELPVVNIVLNNSAYGWVKWAEKAWYQGSFSASELQSMDFSKVAEGLGCVGMRVEAPDQLESALTEALSLNKPVVLEVITDDDSTPNVG
jgi:acetolactate synthase-1/2/3 large subunit